GAGQAVLQLELEIAGRAAAPDAEDVLRRLVVSFGFADEGAAFDTPEIGIAVPTFEGCAVEHGLEAGLVEGDEHVAAAAAAARAASGGRLLLCQDCEYTNQGRQETHWPGS